MPDIPSAGAVSAIGATAAAASNNIVVETAVNNVPDKIAMLSRQIEVTGTLAEPPQGTTITINTLIGPLTLILPQLAQAQQDKLIQQLTSLFQNQRALTVVMQPGNPPSQALLLLPPLTAAAQNAAGSSLQTSAQNLPPLLPNITLTAIVLPNSATPPQAAGALSYAAGFNAAAANASATGQSAEMLITEQVLADLQQQLPPNPSTSFPPAPLLAQDLQSALPNAAVPAQNIPAAYLDPGLPSAPIPAGSGVAGLLQPGMELNLRVTAVINPQNSSPLPELQPNQVLATVVGSGPGGQIILKAGDSTLFVRQPVSVPQGTQLVITVDAAPNDAGPITVPEALEFSTLPQVMAALSQVDPSVLKQVIAARVPQPGETLPSTLLLFLSAVRDGDIRGWLGSDATDALTRAGKAELITRLTQELQQTGQTSHDDVVGDWRSYAVPVLDQNNNLALFYLHIHGHHQRRHGDSNNNNQSSDGKNQPSQVRFVIDVRMSRLGVMQLDGFLRQKKLDIVMRSENRLPPWLDGELRQTYQRTMDAIGYTGGISFQSGRGGWVKIQKPGSGAAVVT